MRRSLQFFSVAKQSCSLTASQTRWFSSSTFNPRLEMTKKRLVSTAWLYGLESSTYAEILNNYGVELQLAGYKQEALQVLEAALQTKVNLYGDKHPELASTYANLASLFAEKNMSAEAIEFYQKAIELKRTDFGCHPEIALFKSNLASVFFKQGDANQAKMLLEQAYTSLLKAYGENDERTLKVKAQLDNFEVPQSVTRLPSV